jgi:hypothetical protein
MARKKVARRTEEVITSETDPTKKTTIIRPLNMKILQVKIVGTAPYVHGKFSVKAREKMRKGQEEGAIKNSKKPREKKNFKLLLEEATHRTPEGWAGIPCPSFRNALISACRTVAFKMTHAKLAVFCEADGNDATDGMPLVRIKGVPGMFTLPCRNADGSTDIHPRPIWKPGWSAVVRIRWDADMFSQEDVVNLLVRAGVQVGIGAGRPDSRNSAGLGFGTFQVL